MIDEKILQKINFMVDYISKLKSLLVEINSSETDDLIKWEAMDYLFWINRMLLVF